MFHRNIFLVLVVGSLFRNFNHCGEGFYWKYSTTQSYNLQLWAANPIKNVTLLESANISGSWRTLQDNLHFAQE